MKTSKMLAVAGSGLFGFVAPCLCLQTQTALAQGPATRGAKPAAISHAVEYVRQSPLRRSNADAPALLKAVNGAMLSVDEAGMQALKQIDAVELQNFVLSPELSVNLDLHRVNIFADNAQILASHLDANGEKISQQLAVPEMTILAGKAIDDPDSVAVISISEFGTQGFVNRLGETYVLSSGSVLEQGAPVVFRLDQQAGEILGMPDFECGADTIAQPNVDPNPLAGGFGGGGPTPPPCRVAKMAIETDYEFTQNLFGGNTGAAVAYAGTLMAGSSEIFKRDVNVRFQITFIQLWTTPADPWDQNGGTSDQLYQFRDYWQDNNEWIDRDLAHFMSGRSLGGGVAWLSAMCADTIDYGLSANLRGTFPYPTQMQSQFNWDIIVCTHELGHNFGSPHTHSYSPQIDGCGTGNCNGAQNGTLMSYCHQCPGGIANMNIRFHETVIARILDYLDNETLCNLLDVAGPPDPNNDFFYIASNTPTRMDVLRNDLSGSCSPPTINSFDASSLMGGTVALSVGTGPNGRNELLYTPPNGFTGADQFFYWVGNNGGAGNIAGGQVKMNVIPLRTAENPGCTEPGLYAAYYELNNPQVVPDYATLDAYDAEVVSALNYPSSEGNFANSGRADGVGAVFTGYLNIPSSGAYTISVLSDDGSKVYLGSEMILNNDGLHGMDEKVTVRGLQAGLHKLRVDFFENGGGAGLLLTISSPGIFKQVVPASMFRHDGMLLADFVSSGTFLPPGDGKVDGADLAYMLGEWGSTPGSIADIVGSVTFLPPADNTVDGADLAYLLGAWGQCN